MTRSEEELRVGTDRQERGRARLRKYVVTEQAQQTVPVRHEEVRVEREPITDANREEATSGPEISEGEYEVTLHEEVPVSTSARCRRSASDWERTPRKTSRRSPRRFARSGSRSTTSVGPRADRVTEATPPVPSKPSRV